MYAFKHIPLSRIYYCRQFNHCQLIMSRIVKVDNIILLLEYIKLHIARLAANTNDIGAEQTIKLSISNIYLTQDAV